MTATVRNVLIVLGLAALLAFAPGGGTTGGVIVQVLSIAFLVALSLMAYSLYREHRLTLYGLGDRNRGILYGSLALAVLAIAGASELWATGPGTLVWFVLVGLAGFGVFAVWRAAREY